LPRRLPRSRGHCLRVRPRPALPRELQVGGGYLAYLAAGCDWRLGRRILATSTIPIRTGRSPSGRSSSIARGELEAIGVSPEAGMKAFLPCGRYLPEAGPHGPDGKEDVLHQRVQR